MERVVTKHINDPIMIEGHNRLQIDAIQSEGELQVYENKDLLEKRMVYIVVRLYKFHFVYIPVFNLE